MAHLKIILFGFLLLLGISSCLGVGKPGSGTKIDPPSNRTKITPKVITPGARSEEIRLQWALDTSKMPIKAYQKINLKVEAISLMPLKNENFQVFLNEELYNMGDKAGEVPLQLSAHKFLFEQTVYLPTQRIYAIRVEARVNGQYKRLRTITVQNWNIPPPVSIVWKSPDPIAHGGNPILHDKGELEVNATIEAGGDILPSQVEFNLNGRPFPRSPGFQMVESNGKYAIRETIVLDNITDIQTILMEVNEIPSDLLLIKYVPYAKPQIFVLSIGTKTNLQYSVQDALDFADLFRSQGKENELFSFISVETLVGAQATAFGIESAVNSLKSKMEKTHVITPNDVVILFISTHGFMLGNDFRLQGENYDPSNDIATSKSFKKDIKFILDFMPCKKIIFLDACHSGLVNLNEKSPAPEEISRALEELYKTKAGLAVLSSSKREELSYEDTTWANGAFTEGIVQGLKGKKADFNRNGIITINELAKFLEREVPLMVQSVKKKSQTPVLYNDLGDIAIYIIK
ncbi:MAG: caspase family protein [Saprospiraceae bacterium]